MHTSIRVIGVIVDGAGLAGLEVLVLDLGKLNHCSCSLRAALLFVQVCIGCAVRVRNDLDETVAYVARGRVKSKTEGDRVIDVESELLELL